MDRVALIQVLGGVAYGEWKAYEGAKARAETAATDEERREWRRQAAEELRHHKGFVRRLEALGADPERAMRPFRRSLDAYHSHDPGGGVDGAVVDLLGEGVADDLLRWLKKVADPETAEFIAEVQKDEAGHEARAVAGLRQQMRTRRDRGVALVAAGRMAARMIRSGAPDARPFLAFVRLGRTPELLTALIGGQLRRLAAMNLPVPLLR